MGCQNRKKVTLPLIRKSSGHLIMSHQADPPSIFKTSSSLTILSTAFIKSRLDILSASATNKKPYRESDGVFYFKLSVNSVKFE
jgi:hypothetical protein